LIPNSNFEIHRLYLPDVKNSSNFVIGGQIEMEQLCFWEDVQIPNRFGNKNSRSQTKLKLV
jgi:hypothetical protein